MDMEDLTVFWTIESIGPNQQKGEKRAAKVVVIDDRGESLNYSLEQIPGGETYLIDSKGGSIITVRYVEDIRDVAKGDRIAVSVSVK